MLVGTFFGTPVACIVSRSGLGNGMELGALLCVRCFLAAVVTCAILFCCIRAALLFLFDVVALSALSVVRATCRGYEPLPSLDRRENDCFEWNWRLVVLVGGPN